MPAQARLLRYERSLRRAGYAAIAGVDEAGRGPLAGPVVAAAVIIRNVRFRERIDDSKVLSRQARARAFREILDHAVAGIGIVDEKVIDRINILQATRMAMVEAVRDLSTAADHVMVDGNIPIDAHCPCTCIVRGDALSLSIAAASIVAKVTRDKIMEMYDDLYPRYGFIDHKGYPTRSHIRALKRFGPSPIHRMTFAPVRALSR